MDAKTMDAKMLNDLPIVSVNGAARLGRVKEVLFATDPFRVAALRAADDWGELLVPFERVSSFGKDAIMVGTPDDGERARQQAFKELRSLGELERVKVVDETGAYIGTVKTLEFEPDSGRVQRIVAASGGLLGVAAATTTVEATDLRGVADDLLTISKIREEPQAAH